MAKLRGILGGLGRSTFMLVTCDAEDTATGLHAHSFCASMGTSSSDSEGYVLQRHTVTWVVHCQVIVILLVLYGGLRGAMKQ